MSFQIFQTASATMQKMVKDGYGDLSVDTSFTVEIDPVLGKRRTFNAENEIIEGRETIISPHDSIDLAHERWRLQYNGRTYEIKGIEPFYKLGNPSEIDHYEVTLI